MLKRPEGLLFDSFECSNDIEGLLFAQKTNQSYNLFRFQTKILFEKKYFRDITEKYKDLQVMVFTIYNN